MGLSGVHVLGRLLLAPLSLDCANMVRMKDSYKLERMCDNCPFAENGAGLQLRRSLASGRWREILRGLRKGEHFLCHKTTMNGKEDEEGNYTKGGGERICAGSRAYQAALGIVSDVEQIMERVKAMQQQGECNHGRGTGT
jgi:hypothetical protein